jgi:hypothetical protein
MINVKFLLLHLLQAVGESDEYFVSGSLSFLPLLGSYRQPAHDVDAAVAQELFQKRKPLFGSAKQLHFLRLSEVAIAAESRLAKALAPQTSFVHIDGPNGLLDLSCYRRGARGLLFSLGAGLTLEVPHAVTARFRMLSWEGVSYQAGPPELAFIPKAAWYLRARPALSGRSGADLKHLEDLKRLVRIVDWDFVRQLLEQGGLRWFGYRLPGRISSWFDPFAASEVLALRDRAIYPD